MNRSLFLSLTVGLLGAAAVSAATYPTGFTESVVYAGLQSPAGMDFAPDGRLFIGEQKGKVYLVKNDTLRTPPILNIQHKVDYNVERGFQAIVLDPDFAVNGYLYVYYTARYPASHNRVSRFTVASNNTIDTTETIIFELPNLPTRGGNFTNQNVGPGSTNLAVWHMGGAMVFGNDGKLYVGIGDHEGTANGQNMNSMFGKVLRINANGSIPADNPYYGTATGDLQAIWASGVRSPFTFALHRPTGRIYLTDVGDGAWEEVDTLSRGGNLGWGTCEGNYNINSTSNVCALVHNRPIYAYRHGTSATTTGQGIIGGGFATNFRAQDSGRYFFGDFNNTPNASSTSGWIRSINPATGRDSALFATGISNMTGLKFSPTTGAMYIIARGYNTGIIDTVGTAGKIGYLYKVSYDGAVAVRAPQAPRAKPGLLAAGAHGTLTVPVGVIGIELFDLKGTRLWTAGNLKRDDLVTLPASLPKGVLKYRWIYRD